MAGGTARAAGVVVVAFVILVAGALGVFFWLRTRGLTPPVPGQQRCVATANGQSVALDLDQAHYASIIVGVSVRRGLAPRAATIAMTTVYQETGIRNLDYGDRDSVGLFQQRPSQGWGTKKQLLDPYYSTKKFYDALIKIKNWETGDITEIAQKVQRSGYPEAYRDHEADARVLASVLTGHSPGGWSCLEREGHPGKPATLVRALGTTFGSVSPDRSGQTITIDAASTARAWAYAGFAIGNSKLYGVTTVTVGEQQWHTDALNLPVWTAADAPLSKDTLIITVRAS
jgi:hypothetical protein